MPRPKCGLVRGGRKRDGVELTNAERTGLDEALTKLAGTRRERGGLGSVEPGLGDERREAREFDQVAALSEGVGRFFDEGPRALG